MQQAVSTATGHMAFGASTLQQPAPCQTVGWTARSGPQEQGCPAAGSGLCAGAAATRLLRGLTDHSTQQTTGRTAGSNQYWSAMQDVQPRANLTAVRGTYLRQPQPGDAVWAGGIESESGVQVQGRTQGAPMPQTWPVRAAEAAGQTLSSTAAAAGRLGGTCEPAQPARLVVIDMLPQQQQTQQQLAPWQQQEAQAGFTDPGQQADPTQHHHPEDAAAQAQLELPLPTHQQQKRQVTFPVPLSPVKSPRKHPAGRRWALLQKLKAVNRGKAPAAAAGKSDAAAQLVAQLQQLMQGPAGAVHVTAGVDCSKDSWRPDLDAAAAMSLHVQPQPQPCSVVDPQQQQQQQQQGDNGQGLGAANVCSPQASGSAADESGQLAAQFSLHSAGAQTSEVLGPEASAPMADASVQAASVTAQASTGSGPGQQQCQQGALELAQLILVAVEKSGGVILPEAGEHTCSRMGSAAGRDDRPGTLSGTQQLLQGSSWGMLPNPFAGTAAPQFQQVVDLQPDAFFESCGLNPAPAELLGQEDGQVLHWGAQQGMQQFSVLYEEVQQQPSQQYVSSGSPTQHGCCFAACPRHISSPELGESVQPQQQHLSRRTGGLNSSSSRNAGGTKSQQQPQRGSGTGAGRSLAGAPSLARSARPSTASARQMTARTSKASSRRLSDPQVGASAGQQASRQQQQVLRRQASTRQAATQQDTGSKAPVSPNTWACEQTKQLDELWQQWHKQHVKTLPAVAAAGDQPKQQADAQQELLAAKERQELEVAYARASAARSSAKKAAQHAAASRSQRLRAELMDLGRMLAEVDTLAAQMERESTQAAAAVEQFEADLNSRNRQGLRASAAGSVGMCSV